MGNRCPEGNIVFSVLVGLVLTACAGAPSIEVASSHNNAGEMSAPASKLLVMALYPEQDVETRVAIENAVVGALRESGIDVDAGYREFESYDGLDTRVAELKSALSAGGFDALLIVDPIRVKQHDPGEWAERRSAYRALGLDTSAGFNLLGQLAEQADAAQAEIDVLLWNPASESFVWHTEYDLNAPGSYELEVARQYADALARMVADSLRKEGLVK